MYVPNITVVKLAAVLLLGVVFLAVRHINLCFKCNKYTKNKNKRFPGCQDKRPRSLLLAIPTHYVTCVCTHFPKRSLYIQLLEPTQSVTDLWSRNTYLPKRKPPPPSPAFPAIDSTDGRTVIRRHGYRRMSLVVSKEELVTENIPGS